MRPVPAVWGYRAHSRNRNHDLNCQLPTACALAGSPPLPTQLVPLGHDRQCRRQRCGRQRSCPNHGWPHHGSPQPPRLGEGRDRSRHRDRAGVVSAPARRKGVGGARSGGLLALRSAQAASAGTPNPATRIPPLHAGSISTSVSDQWMLSACVRVGGDANMHPERRPVLDRLGRHPRVMLMPGTLPARLLPQFTPYLVLPSALHEFLNSASLLQMHS